MTTKFIKNTTQNPKTYEGQEILAGAYYQIQPSEEVRWSNSSLLLSDIGSGDAVVAKTNTGLDDISDVSDAINFLKSLDPGPKDTDGAPLTRTKITKSGWHFQLHGVEFSTSTINSLYNKDVVGNDLGFATIKFYDATDTELTAGTQAELDADCVKTVVQWEPDHTIEVIGGALEQSENPTSDVRLWITAVPDLPVAYGGSVPFAQGGVNLRRLTGGLELDGKTPKEMPYSATYHTSKFQLTLKHDAGVKHPIHILFKIFRENT